jgi:hypothetical protein
VLVQLFTLLLHTYVLHLATDVDMMKGSTVDAMGEAIDNCDVMLYSVSEAYKESGNCRLEVGHSPLRAQSRCSNHLMTHYAPSARPTTPTKVKKT